MKMISLLTLTLFPMFSMAYTCDVVTINNSKILGYHLAETNDSFEPEKRIVDVTPGLGLADIGSLSFIDGKRGATIGSMENEKQADINVGYGQGQTLKVRVYKSSLKGILLHKKQNDAKYTLVAELDCNDTSLIEKAMTRNKTVQTEISVDQIPKDVLRKISKVDVAFEMGDGYYSVQSEKIYAHSIDGKLVGYELVSQLSYTEGDDEESRTYFLANGIRFSGPNRN